MRKEELADKLGLPEGKAEGDAYVVSLDGSDAYAKAYTALGDSVDVTLSEESVTVTEESAGLLYSGSDLEVQLLGDFDKDEYKVVITDAKEAK